MRGCVANLEGADKDRCVENDDTCKTCHRSGCNMKSAFAECVVTNGVVHIDYKPKRPTDDKIFTKICKKYDDSCFVLANDVNIVIRDCVGEYMEKNEVSADFLSDNYNATSYEVCSEPLCNDHDVKAQYCLSCDSRYDGHCNNATSTARKRCFLEVKSSGCYHFEGDHVERGCITDIDGGKRTLCESDSETCKKCMGNECNSKTVFQTCLTTDEKNLSNNFTKLCKRYTDRCFVHVLDNNTRRGCVSDLIESPIHGIDLMEDCKNEKICEICSDRNNCNDREVKEEHCLVCSTKDDLFCSYYPEKLQTSERCPMRLKRMGCFLSRNGALHAERGCMSQLDEREQYNCKRPKSTECKMCLGDNCNEKRYFQQCVDCNSEVDGQHCIDNVFVDGGTRMCENYSDQCYTVVRNGLVIRNCTGDETIPDEKTCKDNPDNCKLCSNKGRCNDDVIKTITCVSCDSTIDVTCGTNTTFSQFKTCPISIYEPSCYHLIDDNQLHRRGTYLQLNI